MKTIKKIFILYFLFFIFAACEKIIEFRGEETEPYLVVNSITTTDSVFTSFLSKSLFIFSEEANDSTNFPLTNGKIDLYVNGEFWETIPHTEKGAYQSTYRAQAGDTVRIEASAPNFNTISATGYFPSKSTILSLDTIVSKEVESGNTIINCKLKFQDNAAVTDYYRMYSTLSFDTLQVIRDPKTQIIIATKVKNFKREISRSNDPVFYDDDDAFASNRYFIFNDKKITGETYTIEYSMSFSLPKSAFNVFINVDLQTISSDIYKYLKSLNDFNSISGMMSSEPVKIYSNVHGGLGIIGGITSNVVSREIKLICKL